MSRRCFGLMVGLFASVALADEPEIMPVVHLSAPPGSLISQPEPKRLPPSEVMLEPAIKPMPIPKAETLPPATCYLPEPCNTCGCKPAPRGWFNLEYLLWTVKDEPMNSVIFTQAPIGASGALGAANTRAIYGSSPIDLGDFNGGRIEAGYWFNSCNTIGLEASGFVLERGGNGESTISGPNDSQSLYHTFVNQNTGAESAIALTAPPVIQGGTFAFASSHLWGLDTDIVLNVRDRSCYRIDALFGFRYLDLRETLIAGTSSFAPGFSSVNVSTIDSFATRNQFYGAQAGLRATARRGRFELSATQKLALGTTHEVLDIVGQSSAVGRLTTTTSPAGILALESNQGRRVRDRFAALPETILKLTYRITEHWSGYVAYDFLYLSNVMRPGDQVDRVVNPQQVPVLTGFNPTPLAGLPVGTRPTADAIAGDFFAQGVTLGVGVTY